MTAEEEGSLAAELNRIVEIESKFLKRGGTQKG